MEKYLILVSTLLLIAVHGQEVNNGTSSNVTTKTTTTTVAPKSTASTAASTSSTVAPTKSTTTKTTTPEVTTAGPKPPTTSVAPTMIPAPVSDNGTEPGTFQFSVVNPKNKSVCIMGHMAMEMIFSYVKKTGNTTKNVGVQWNLPNTTSVSNKSDCGNVTQKLVLTFFEGWELTMVFNKTSGDKSEVVQTSLTYKLSDRRFRNITTNSTKPIIATATSNNVMFSWADNTYLKCNSNVNFGQFSKPEPNATLDHLVTMDVVMIAFKSNNETVVPKNAAYTYCQADTSVSNIVPIAVGAALAGLVLIVLIAYLIGRSRNQRGYESV